MHSARRLLTLIFTALLLACPAFGQFANITHTGITDESGNPLANGQECFTPVANSGTPITAIYPGGTVTKQQKCYAVTAGVLQAGVTLVKSNVTTPLNLCYQMTLKNVDTSVTLIGPSDGYGCIQPTGDVDLHTVPPNLPALSLVTAGPRGIGFNWRGAWSPNGIYAVNDVTSFDGSSWICIQANGTGAGNAVHPDPPTDINATNYWQLQASAGQVTTIQMQAAISAAINGTSTQSVNLFNPAAVTSNTALLSSDGTTPSLSGFTVTDFMLTNGATTFVTNGQYGSYGPVYGAAFYDVNKVYISGYRYTGSDPAGAGMDAPALTPVRGPPGAFYLRLYFKDAIQPLPYSQIMVVAGTTVPPSYVPFGSTTSGGGLVTTPQMQAAIAAAIGGLGTPSASPMAGQNVAWLGDSISWGAISNLPLSPLVNAITGSVDYYSLSWPGRVMANALDNSNQTNVPFPTQATIQNAKYLVLWLGTNLSNLNIGSITDAPSVGTANANGITFPATDSYYAVTKGVLNQLYAWNPNLRIIKLSPYQSSNQNANTNGAAGCAAYPAAPCAAGLAILYSVHTADLALGQMYSMPVVDMYSQVGIGPQNFATALGDNVHPTAATQTNIIAPFIARKLIEFAKK